MKNNYLLVIPRFIREIGDSYAFPLGIPYIAASMKRAGYNLTCLNLNQIEGDIDKIIMNTINQHSIHVVATGGMCLDYSNIRAVLDIVKSYDNNIVTIVGGAIITGDPEASMEALELVDYGIIGEGEITVCELCNALEQRLDTNSVSGIIYKKNGQYVQTSHRGDIKNLDSLSWPDYESFGFKDYMEKVTPANVVANKRNTLFMLTSRSCPYQCTFCFHPEGVTYRQRSVDDVFAEIDYLTTKYKIEYIFFVDELFGTYLDRLKEFCIRIKKYNLRGWYAFFRVDQVSVEKLNLLKDAGCSCMFFGLESADNRILSSMKKRITIEQIESALTLVTEMGIAVDGNFIFGDIEETLETSMNTLKWWREHPEYKINLGTISVYPGSDLYKYAVSKSMIRDRVAYLRDRCPDINISKMNDDEYSYIMDVISKERKKMNDISANLKVVQINYSKAQYDLEFVCEKCSNYNFWEKINMFGFNYLACDNCGQNYNLPIVYEAVDIVKQNLEKILDKYDKMAIWGINEIVELFLSKIDLMASSNIYLIDNSSKRKKDIYDKTIYAPSFVDKEKIKIVIVGVPYHFDTIRTQIIDNKFQVDHVIDICQLLNRDWNIKEFF